ncbi:MAG: 7TM-DISM domain-containing protein [Bacteroidota bacterium]|nr:7TM-DISM domain-containing protein [Bacteroidota bacterium]
MPVLKSLYLFITFPALILCLFSQGQPGKQPDFFLYEDASKTLNSNEALSLFEKGKFRKTTSTIFNPGFNNAVFWLAYYNERELPADSLLLHIGDHHINRIHFYYAGDSVVEQLFETGDYYPFSQRPLAVKGFYFPVSKKGLYLARVDKSNESLQMVFWLTSLRQAVRTEGKIGLVMALLSGMMMLMILFGLYLFYISRERIYFIISPISVQDGYGCWPTAVMVFNIYGLIFPGLPVRPGRFLPWLPEHCPCCSW